MLDESEMLEDAAPPSAKESASQESAPARPSSRLGALRFIGSLCLAALLGGGMGAATVLRGPWLTRHPHAQDIAILKSQAASLDNRVSRLEGRENISQESIVNGKQLQDLEGRMAALHQQIEALQNAPHPEPSQLLEQSHGFEKDLNRLTKTSQLLKSTLLFWRLRAKALSGAPYAAELDAFKASQQGSEDLSILEKYADQGLQGIKETSSNSSLSASDSWWTRLTGAARSIIKIQKIDAPIPLPSADQSRQSVENALAQLDQALTKKLSAIPLSSSPLSGDAL